MAKIDNNRPRNATPTKSQPKLSDSARRLEFVEAFGRALEAQGLDPNPSDPSPEHFEIGMKVAADYGLFFDTGQRSPDGQIIWARGRKH
jgi:hypothetical protein